MTRRSIAEYVGGSRGGGYFWAAKKAKTAILNEFVATTGMHRKTVIRLLNPGVGGWSFREEKDEASEAI